MDENRQELLAIGADDFIGKPFQEAELFHKIQTHLGVEFLYAEELADRGRRRRWPNSQPESVACLPQDLIHLMRDAVIAADLDQLLAKVEDVEAIAPDIARGLRALAEQFEYQKLLDLFGPERPSAKGLAPRPRRFVPSRNFAGEARSSSNGFCASRRLIAIALTIRSIALPGKVEHVCKRKPPNLATGKSVMPRPAVGEMPVAGPASILVVDDVSANLRVLTGMLKDRGYKVRPVPSGELALLAARKDPPGPDSAGHQYAGNERL